MKKINHRSRNVTKGLLAYLDEIGEQKILPEVTRSLEEVLSKAKRSDEIVVVSAIPLVKSQLGLLKSILSKSRGVNLPIKNKTDKSLIGGFTVRINDWFLDASIIQELEILKRSLLS